MEPQNLLIDHEVMKHLSEQSKEKVRQTMLRHEQTFRNQVQELHKLHRVQRMLMQNADNDPPQAMESFALTDQTVVNPHHHHHQITFNSTQVLQNQRYSSGEASLQYTFEWGNRILQQNRTEETIQHAALLSFPTKAESIAPLEDESWRPALKSIPKRKKPIDLEQLPCDDDETEDEQEDSPNQLMATNDSNSLNNASSHEYSTASNFSRQKDLNYPPTQTMGNFGLFCGPMKDNISDSGKLSSESCSQEKQVQKGPRVNFLTTCINPPQDKSSERVSAFPKWMKTAEKPRDDEPSKQAQQSQGSIALTRENSTQASFLQVIDIHPKTIGNSTGTHSVVTDSQKLQRRTEWSQSETEHCREGQLFYDSSNVYIPTYHMTPVTGSASMHSSQSSYLQFLQQQQQQAILQSQQQTSSTMQLAWLPPGNNSQGSLGIYGQPPHPLGLLGGVNLDASQSNWNFGFRSPKGAHSPNLATFPTNIAKWKEPSKLVPDGVDVEFKLGLVDNTIGKEVSAESLSPESNIHKNRMGEALNEKLKNERFRVGIIEATEDNSTSTTFQNTANGLSAQRIDDDAALPDFRHCHMSTSSAFSSINNMEHLKDAFCSRNVSQFKLHQENRVCLGNNNTNKILFDKDNEQEAEKQKTDKATNRLISHGKQNCEILGFEHNTVVKENRDMDLLNRNMENFKLQSLTLSNEESGQLLFYYFPKPSMEDNKPGVSSTESQPKEENTDHSTSNLRCNNSVITLHTDKSESDKASVEFGSRLPDFVEKPNAKLVEVMETSLQLSKGSSRNPERGVIEDDIASLAATILMSFSPEETTSSKEKANIGGVECQNESMGQSTKVTETHETAHSPRQPLEDYSVCSGKEDANTMNKALGRMHQTRSQVSNS